ncbi:hypothetical protein FXW78_46455 [Rhodococcus opacus]|nr:hypothetical protein [Rhodococcus opacus]
MPTVLGRRPQLAHAAFSARLGRQMELAPSFDGTPDHVESGVVQLIFEMDADREGVQMAGCRRSGLSQLRERPPPSGSLVVTAVSGRRGGITHVLHALVLNPQRGKPLHSPNALSALADIWTVRLLKPDVTGHGSCYGTDAAAVRRESVVVRRRRINGMADNDINSPDPPSAKAITALVREARSLSRRADKLGGTASAVDDPTTQQLAAEACTSVEQLVHHLTVLERQLQRREKEAVRRDP